MHPHSQTELLPGGHEEDVRGGLAAHSVAQVVAAHDAVAEAREEVRKVPRLGDVVLPSAPRGEGHGNAVRVEVADEAGCAREERDGRPEAGEVSVVLRDVRVDGERYVLVDG